MGWIKRWMDGVYREYLIEPPRTPWSIYRRQTVKWHHPEKDKNGNWVTVYEPVDPRVQRGGQYESLYYFREAMFLDVFKDYWFERLSWHKITRLDMLMWYKAGPWVFIKAIIKVSIYNFFRWLSGRYVVVRYNIRKRIPGTVENKDARSRRSNLSLWCSIRA